MRGKIWLSAAVVGMGCTIAVWAQAHFQTSLHATREGKRTAYAAENGGFERITGVPIEQLGCMKCHSSTGKNAAGQDIDPATYEPGCNDCHDASFNVAEETCLNCHTRQKVERAKFPGVDAHTNAGLTCISCHTKEELHGDDGVAYASLKEEGAIKVKCTQCHTEVSQTPGHVIHADTVDCAACHSVTVVNCVSCHFESLIQGRTSRPNAQIQNYKLLVKKNGKVHVGSLMTHTYDGKTNYIISSFHSHVITKDAVGCEDCHYQFGGANPAIAEYNETGQITLNKWNPETKKIDGPQGVVPIPVDWETALQFDFAVYTGDPADPTTDPEAWEYLKTGADNKHLFYAEPLDAETMQKLGMVVRAAEPEIIDTLYFPMFANGTAGDIAYKTSLMLANVGEDATLVISFFDRSGAPLDVILDGAGPQSTFEVEAWKGRTYSVETPGDDGGLQVGYVVVQVKAPASSPMATSDGAAPVGGTAVFIRSDNGIIMTEGGVPAARPMTDFTVLLDSSGRRDTGLALVNPAGTDAAPGSTATVTLTVWDPDFQNQIAQAQVQLDPGQAIGQFIWEIFRDAGADAAIVDQLKETKASVTVSSTVPIAAVVLRQNDDMTVAFPEDVPSLTAFPVIPGRADAEAMTAQQ
ncbi:MAG: hypothetical protein Kow00109_04620 [Acidobacteriota bacterium]